MKSNQALNKAMLRQLVGDPKFYDACPHYLFMADHGVAAHAEWQKAVLAGGAACGGCSGPRSSDASIINGAVRNLVLHTMKLFDHDPKNLDDLRQYLSQKLRLSRKIETFTLYYKNDEDVVAKFVF